MEYHKDGLQQFVFFPVENVVEEEYCNQLFQYHKVPGFLNYRLKEINNQQYLYYRLQFKTSLAFVKEYLSFHEEMVEEMVQSIVRAIQTTKEYLLSYDCIIWSTDYVFVNIETGQLQFCYCPIKTDQKDICSFLSELLQFVGKKNEKSLLLLTKLYHCITEPDFQEDDLLTFFVDTRQTQPQTEEPEDFPVTIEEIMKEKENGEENKKPNEKRNDYKHLIPILILAMVNIILVILLFYGKLNQEYYPVLLLSFILLCGFILLSILNQKEDNVDLIMEEYFQNMIEDENAPIPLERNPALCNKGIICESFAENQKESLQNQEKKMVYGETTILTNTQQDKEQIIVEESPKELCLFPWEKEKYPIINIQGHSIVIGCMKENCDYVLSERGISRIHAKIMKVEGILYLLDLNSTNGTFLNGEQLEKGKDYILENGDMVAFSQITFYVGEKPE
ncbi:MAG: DUF6382 domain-containing protein [Lachnospiraceae bacterium]